MHEIILYVISFSSHTLSVVSENSEAAILNCIVFLIFLSERSDINWTEKFIVYKRIMYIEKLLYHANNITYILKKLF